MAGTIVPMATISAMEILKLYYPVMTYMHLPPIFVFNIAESLSYICNYRGGSKWPWFTEKVYHVAYAADPYPYIQMQHTMPFSSYDMEHELLVNSSKFLQPLLQRVSQQISEGVRRFCTVSLHCNHNLTGVVSRWYQWVHSCCYVPFHRQRLVVDCIKPQLSISDEVRSVKHIDTYAS